MPVRICCVSEDARRRVRDEIGAAESRIDADDPAEIAQAAEGLRRAEALLARLPDEQAEAIRLRVFDGLRLSEIAEVLGCPVEHRLFPAALWLPETPSTWWAESGSEAMNCQECQNVLDNLLVAEPAAAEETALAEHMETCPDCAAAVRPGPAGLGRR